jgi:hypothetical protein
MGIVDYLDVVARLFLLSPVVRSFPHHVHVGPSDHVESSEDTNIAKVCVLVEAEMLRTERPANRADH